MIFYTIERWHIRSCASIFLVLASFEIGGCADDSEVDGGADIGILGSSAIVSPAKSC